jgi:hypothetical protein
MTIEFYTGSAWSEVQVVTPGELDPPGRPSHVTEAFVYEDNNWRSIHSGGGSIEAGHNGTIGLPFYIERWGYDAQTHRGLPPIGFLNRGGAVGVAEVDKLFWAYDLLNGPGKDRYYELGLLGPNFSEESQGDISGIRVQYGDSSWHDVFTADEFSLRFVDEAPIGAWWRFYATSNPGWVEGEDYEFKILQ